MRNEILNYFREVELEALSFYLKFLKGNCIMATFGLAGAIIGNDPSYEPTKASLGILHFIISILLITYYPKSYNIVILSIAAG